MEIEEAVKELRKGKIIAFPTETSYGLACDPFNEKAVKKLHELKGEPQGKPVLLIVAGIHMAEEISFVDGRVKALAKEFMPGPLTLLARKKKNIPDFLALEKIGFRISGNKIARELSRKFGKPITGTSANPHGKEPAYTPEKVREYFPKIGVVDGGKLKKKEASTIYDIEAQKVVRKGKIKETEIKKVLEKLK